MKVTLNQTVHYRQQLGRFTELHLGRPAGPRRGAAQCPGDQVGVGPDAVAVWDRTGQAARVVDNPIGD